MTVYDELKCKEKECYLKVLRIEKFDIFLHSVSAVLKKIRWLLHVSTECKLHVKIELFYFILLHNYSGQETSDVTFCLRL